MPPQQEEGAVPAAAGDEVAQEARCFDDAALAEGVARVGDPLRLEALRQRDSSDFRCEIYVDFLLPLSEFLSELGFQFLPVFLRKRFVVFSGFLSFPFSLLFCVN